MYLSRVPFVEQDFGDCRRRRKWRRRIYL